MAYPDYPNQRIYVLKDDEKIDLTSRFGLVLIDGFELNPPEPKYYTVDIPGGNWYLDLTEAVYGDVPYNTRTQKFTFLVIDPSSFEQVKTRVSNFLHGRKFRYQLSWDEEYTYVGRFKISSYKHTSHSHPNIVGYFEVEVESDPYKYKESPIVAVDAVGGTIVKLEPGRKRVLPTFEFDKETTVEFNGKQYIMPKGTYTITETAPPSEEYNPLTSPITVKILPKYSGTELTELKYQIGEETPIANNLAVDENTITVEIKNNKGKTLPTTGGIGTKIFYIVGGMLVIGSGAALVIKKRIGKDEE